MGFNKNVASSLSLVAQWMSTVDLFLEDGQQYGNMEDAASARTPATCLEVWSGNHRQTPGGLEKSKELKAFRKKLTKRPLALRCQTQYITMRYLDCPEGHISMEDTATPGRRLHGHRPCSCAGLA